MISLSNIEKAKKAFEELQSLDAEIINIEKIALLLSSGAGSIQFDIKANEVKTEMSIALDYEDEMRKQLENAMRRGSLVSWHAGHCEESKKDKHDHRVKIDPTPKLALQILAVILTDKNERRQYLITCLQNLGVSI